MEKEKKIWASPIEANFRWLFESFFIAKNTTWELSIINERTWEAQQKRLVLLVKSKASTLCLSANIIFFHGSLHLCPCLQFSLVCVRGNFCLLSLFLCPLRSPGKRLNWRKIEQFVLSRQLFPNKQTNYLIIAVISWSLPGAKFQKE